MRNDRTKSQVTVEDLLSLKRAERPDAEFWHQFEREMRVKQLAAIVEPRPFWAPFIRVGSRMARFQLPVGATAILALTFLTVREYRLPEATDTQFISQSVASIAPVNTTEVAFANTVETTAQDTITENIVSEANVMVASNEPAAEPASVAVEVQPESVYSPADEAIAANLAAVRAKTPELARLIARVSGVEEIINPRSPSKVVDPLVRVKAPSTSRTSRLLASALLVKYTGGRDTRGSVTRVERGLIEDRVYDSISRFGVKADRLAIRF